MASIHSETVERPPVPQSTVQPTAMVRGRMVAVISAIALLAGAAGGYLLGWATAPTKSETVTKTVTAPASGLTPTSKSFRAADPDAVAVANRFVAAYNEGRPALSRFWDYSGTTSSWWVNNAWLFPHCLSKTDICPNPVERVGPVTELGKFGQSHQQSPAPVLLAFPIRHQGGFGATWVVAFTANGQHVLNVWVP